MSDQTKVFDDLVQYACFAADDVAIDFPIDMTNAQKTRAIINRALDALIANGYLAITPKDDWPSWYEPSKSIKA